MFAVRGRGFREVAIERVVEKGPSVVLLFGFEHVILASKMCVGFAKYFVTLVDRATDGNWQGKGAFVFYLELCGFGALVRYVAFFPSYSRITGYRYIC